MLLLDVAYEEKDEAKKLGARWNPELKKWYVPNKEDYPKFIKWIGDAATIMCDYIYIVEGEQNCFRCGKPTRVIGFGLGNYYCFADFMDTDEKYEYVDNEIHITPYFDEVPKKVIEYVQQKYNYKKRYSKTTKSEYYSNGCDHCNVLQGDFFLFDEVDSPFFIYDEETVKKLKIYQIPLEYDIITGGLGWSSDDEIIKKHAKIIPLELP